VEFSSPDSASLAAGLETIALRWQAGAVDGPELFLSIERASRQDTPARDGRPGDFWATDMAGCGQPWHRTAHGGL